MESCHKPQHEPFSLDSIEGAESMTKQMHKFKSHLVTRCSEDLEEENKHLKELLRLRNTSADLIIEKATVPARNSSQEDTHKIVPLFSPYDRCLSRK